MAAQSSPTITRAAGGVIGSSPSLSHDRGRSDAPGVRQKPAPSDGWAEFEKALDALEPLGARAGYRCAVYRLTYELPDNLKVKVWSFVDDTRYTSGEVAKFLIQFLEPTGIKISDQTVMKHRRRLGKASGCSCPMEFE